MRRFLVATDSVHTSAAACDYLADRLRPDDHVTAVTVHEGGAERRDGGDALNVVAARLGATASISVETLEGEPVAAVSDVLDGEQIDEAVVGARRGAPGAESHVGTTARAIVLGADVPVVVVPQERLD